MEQKIEKDKLLTILLDQAKDAFLPYEKKADILKILKTSDSFNGKNHIFLVDCYFDDDPIFLISREEAFNQANLALKEGNNFAYYYLYKLNKDQDEVEARNCLRFAVDHGYSKAYLEMARCCHLGEIFEKSIDQAIFYYKKACHTGEQDAYFYLCLLYAQLGETKKEEELYLYGLSRGFNLPGVVE